MRGKNKEINIKDAPCWVIILDLVLDNNVIDRHILGIFTDDKLAVKFKELKEIEYKEFSQKNSNTRVLIEEHRLNI